MLSSQISFFNDLVKKESVSDIFFIISENVSENEWSSDLDIFDFEIDLHFHFLKTHVYDNSSFSSYDDTISFISLLSCWFDDIITVTQFINKVNHFTTFEFFWALQLLHHCCKLNYAQHSQSLHSWKDMIHLSFHLDYIEIIDKFFHFLIFFNQSGSLHITAFTYCHWAFSYLSAAVCSTDFIYHHCIFQIMQELCWVKWYIVFHLWNSSLKDSVSVNLIAVWIVINSADVFLLMNYINFIFICFEFIDHHVDSFWCLSDDSVMKSHESDSGDDDSKHVYMIAVFLLIRLLYLLIHSLNHLFKSIQIFIMLADLIDLIVISSLIACCLLNSSLKLTFSHWCSHSKMTHSERSHFFITKQQQY